ncbi:MAG TPA: hypothetical protein VKU89_10380 [Solirubrobacteraceae bacterium]|nr:hypothetical protein [Solirubrobacteraceae bacterium]
MSETIIIPWYATGLRADELAGALERLAPTALRYGASDYALYRSLEDLYRFQQLATFSRHEDFDRYWEGPEMTDFRTIYSGCFQVPVLYGPWQRTTAGRLTLEQATVAEG